MKRATLTLLATTVLCQCGSPNLNNRGWQWPRRDKWSFVEQSRKPAEYGDRTDPSWVPTDQDAIRFSSNVVILLRSKMKGARVTRDITNTAQVSLAALAGANAAFSFSDSALAVLGLGSALIPDFQNIFNARGRAETYTDAVRLIETAQNEYLAYNQQPSATYLTQNGVTLIQRTQASIHVVEKALTGRMPSVVDMEQATEPMSKAGAVQTSAGISEALNHMSATGNYARIKSPLPGPTEPGNYNPNNPQANIAPLPPVDVQADRIDVSKWISLQAQAKQFKRLRQFIKDGGKSPEGLTDEQVVTEARKLVETASTRDKINVLIEAKSKNPEDQAADPKPVGDGQSDANAGKPALPEATEPGTGNN